MSVDHILKKQTDVVISGRSFLSHDSKDLVQIGRRSLLLQDFSRLEPAYAAAEAQGFFCALQVYGM